MFLVLDLFHIVLLINCFGKDYIVWDKFVEIYFKKLGKKWMCVEVCYEDEELNRICEIIVCDGCYEFVKFVDWIDSDGQIVLIFNKIVYVVMKEYF